MSIRFIFATALKITVGFFSFIVLVYFNLETHVFQFLEIFLYYLFDTFQLFYLFTFWS